jgi:hypothetical protein
MSGGTITTRSVVEPAREGARRARPQLFVALGCDRPAAPGSRHVLEDLDLVTLGRGDGDRPGSRRETAGGMRTLRLQLPDGRVSKEHARLIWARGRWVLEDAGSKNGVARNGERVRQAVLEDGDLLEVGHTFLRYRDAAAPLDGAADLGVAELEPPAPALATFVKELSSG